MSKLFQKSYLTIARVVELPFEWRFPTCHYYNHTCIYCFFFFLSSPELKGRASLRQEVFKSHRAVCRLFRGFEVCRVCELSLGWGGGLVMQLGFGWFLAIIVPPRNPSSISLQATPVKTYWFTKLGFGTVITFICHEFFFWV